MSAGRRQLSLPVCHLKPVRCGSGAYSAFIQHGAGEATSGRQAHWRSPSGYLQEIQNQARSGSRGGQGRHQRALGAPIGQHRCAAVQRATRAWRTHATPLQRGLEIHAPALLGFYGNEVRSTCPYDRKIILFQLGLIQITAMHLLLIQWCDCLAGCIVMGVFL